MRSGRMARRLVATAGMGAILAMGVLTACGSKEAPAPETVTKTVTETARRPCRLRRRRRRWRSRSTRPAATCSRLRS